MTTVLLASDGSDAAQAALIQGVSVLGPGHTYVALAVVPPAYVPATPLSPMDNHPTLTDPDLEREVEEEEEHEFAKALRELLDGLGVVAERRIVLGDPGQVICEVAREVGAGVIVMGSHGRGWFKRVLLGSVSQHVLQHAPCPVLVVRQEVEGTSSSDEAPASSDVASSSSDATSSD